MRLWTLHPRYLDTRGLVALWREGLLAQKVLAGCTRRYRSHPQLLRFRACEDPEGAIASYLTFVAGEGARRGYRFDTSRITSTPVPLVIEATNGQLDFEWAHLMRKLLVRAPDRIPHAAEADLIAPHPLFRVVAGPIADWERA